MLQSILNAILGGALIGLAASALLLVVGRIAGISGIVGGLVNPRPGEVAWRASFVGGLLAGGLVLALFLPATIVAPAGRSLAVLVVAGLLVGYGTRLGNGCTSGHGICGLTRVSRRSLVATAAFMATGFLSATLFHLITGGTA